MIDGFTVSFLLGGATLAISTASAVGSTISEENVMGCRNGVSGIENLELNVCCVEQCGQCGGENCGAAGGLTGEECCTADIIKAGVSCSSSKKAPCITFTPSMCPNGLPGVQDQSVCCAEECNTQCGGDSCSAIPGTEGKSDCCSSVILDAKIMCEPGGTAPCIMADGTYTPTAEPSMVGAPTPVGGGGTAPTPTPKPTPNPTSPTTSPKPSVSPAASMSPKTTPSPAVSSESSGVDPTAMPGVDPTTMPAAPTLSPSPAAMSDTSPAGASSSSSSSSSSDGLGIIIGSAVAAAAVLLAIVGICCRKRGSLLAGKNRGRASGSRVDRDDESHGSGPVDPSASIIHPHSSKSDDQWPPRQFSLATSRPFNNPAGGVNSHRVSEATVVATPTKSPVLTPDGSHSSPGKESKVGNESPEPRRVSSTAILAASAPAAIAQKLPTKSSPLSTKVIPVNNSFNDGDSDAGSKFRFSGRAASKRGAGTFTRGTVDAITNSPAFRNANSRYGKKTHNGDADDSDAESRQLSWKGALGRKDSKATRGAMTSNENSLVIHSTGPTANTGDGDSDAGSRLHSAAGAINRRGSFTRGATDSSKMLGILGVPARIGDGGSSSRLGSAVSGTDETHSSRASSTLQHLDTHDIRSPAGIASRHGASSDVSSMRSPVSLAETTWDDASFCASDYAASNSSMRV